jgi:hypothetical protein
MEDGGERKRMAGDERRWAQIFLSPLIVSME